MKLIELRQRAGMKQQDLADLAGVDRSMVSYIESGRRNPTYPMVLRIAKALGVEPGAVDEFAPAVHEVEEILAS